MIETIAALLLIASGIFVLLGAVGFARSGDFFVRIHPPALTYTFGTWTVAIAGVLVYSTRATGPALHPLVILVLLFITVPVTSLLLARAVLYRRRSTGVTDVPPPLAPAERAAEQLID